MKITDELWQFAQKHLGYSDEDMKHFKDDPKNEQILTKFLEVMDKTVVAEVVESEGCNSGHKRGDTFVMDPAGNLMTKECPDRVCVHAAGSLSPVVYAASELFLAGVDPNEMCFNRVGCPDVGLKCGGWGRIVMELRVEDR